MNINDEKKLDRLLAEMPKREYDLDAWLAEDETEAFDRMVHEQGRAGVPTDGAGVPGGSLTDGQSVALQFAAGSSGKTAGNKRRRIWRWVAAAACFLAVVGVGLHYQSGERTRPIAQLVRTNPSVGAHQSVSRCSPIRQSVRVSQSIGARQSDKSCASVRQKLRTNPSIGAHQSDKSCASIDQPTVLDSDPSLHYASNDLAKDTGQLDNRPRSVGQASEMLTERDLPITRPENYRYTPEEIALMKKQAREAYLKWVEIELEITRYTLEQTAQQFNDM